MLSRLWKTAFGNIIVMKVWIYARSPVVNDINTGRNLWAALNRTKSLTGTINTQDEYHDDNCGWKHPHCQQDQVSHRPLQQPSDAGFLLVWPLLLLPSPQRARLVRRRSASQLDAVTSTASVDLDCDTWSCLASVSRLQFIDRLGRTGLRSTKLFGFPPGCSFLDREHDLRKILIRHQIHSAKNFLPHWLK